MKLNFVAKLLPNLRLTVAEIFFVCKSTFKNFSVAMKKYCIQSRAVLKIFYMPNIICGSYFTARRFLKG